MAQQVIGIGRVANDGTGDRLRTAFTKVNANFTELYSNRRRTISTTAYTLLTTDDGATLVFTNSDGCTLTVPAGLGVEFNCELVVAGAETLMVLGEVTLIESANSGYELMPKSRGWLDARAEDILVLSGTGIVEPGS